MSHYSTPHHPHTRNGGICKTKAIWYAILRLCLCLANDYNLLSHFKTLLLLTVLCNYGYPSPPLTTTSNDTEFNSISSTTHDLLNTLWSNAHPLTSTALFVICSRIESHMKLLTTHKTDKLLASSNCNGAVVVVVSADGVSLLLTGRVNACCVDCLNDNRKQDTTFSRSEPL